MFQQNWLNKIQLMKGGRGKDNALIDILKTVNKLCTSGVSMVCLDYNFLDC